MIEQNQFIQGDLHNALLDLPDNSVDVVISDLPYGVTQNPKDKKINLSFFWDQIKRVRKSGAAILLTSQFPFTFELGASNIREFRYDLIWDKVLTSGFLNANRMPLRSHEHILVFYDKLPAYNPQYTEGKPLHSKGTSYKDKEKENQNYGDHKSIDDSRKGSTQKHPKSIITFPKPHPSKCTHATEKPIELAEWLLNTYSNEGDLVLDCCAGTGWVALAALKTNRRFYCIELDEANFSTAKFRIKTF